MNLEKSREEKILCDLDENGYIFPGFEFVKCNNELCLLGKGGFSTVYKMECPERPEKRYALKVIGFERQVVTSDNFWNTIRLQKYLCEQSSYICRIISAREIKVELDEGGELKRVAEVSGERWNGDGIHLQFVLMEKLEDIVSKDRYGKVSLTKATLEKEEEIIEFALQVGEVLFCAHKNNVLHRDVKLENIFWDDETQCYKLGDFGMAKFAEGGTAETVVYTDGYGAPEIERRLFDCYGATADIYSFGITLYLLLNDFKFPGSSGYYVNMVQYNPDFIFPAPLHASEGMAKIIRKMCYFYQEDRYQSMAEVLLDLCALKMESARIVENGEIELPDFDTETYRDGATVDNVNRVARRIEPTGREKRREEEKRHNRVYMKSSIRNFIGFVLLVTLILCGLSTNTNFVYNWRFWIFPIMVLLEAILLGVKELHILFGGVTLAVGIYSCVSIGVTVSHALLIMGLFISVPVVTGACAVSSMIWAVLNIFGKTQWVLFVRKYDLSWLFLIVIFFMLNRYMMLRIELNKVSYIRARIEVFVIDKIYLAMAVLGLSLLLLECFGVICIPEVIRRLHLMRIGLISFVIFVIYMTRCGYIDYEPEGAQLYENEMDERRDGGYSDTIK